MHVSDMYSVYLQPPCMNRCLHRTCRHWGRACHDCISMPYLQCRATFALPPLLLLGSYCFTTLVSPVTLFSTAAADRYDIGSKFVPRLHKAAALHSFERLDLHSAT